jgi:hypothetical protein
MVSDLVGQMGRILPFAEQVLEGILYDETELLDEAVKTFYGLIIVTAEFVCDYIRGSSPSGMYFLKVMALS